MENLFIYKKIKILLPFLRQQISKEDKNTTKIVAMTEVQLVKLGYNNQ